MKILTLLIFFSLMITSACDCGFNEIQQTSSQFNDNDDMSDINTDTNSDPEIYKKNQEILEQIEKEQQKKLQEQKAKEDKFNQILNKAKDKDLINDKNKFEEMKNYISSNDYIFLSQDKEKTLNDELKKNPIILAYTNDPDKKGINKVNYVFEFNTNDDLLNKYDPIKKAELERERNKKLKEEKEKDKENLDNYKRKLGDFTEKETEDFLQAVNNYQPQDLDKDKKWFYDYVENISKDLTDEQKKQRRIMITSVIKSDKNKDIFEKFTQKDNFRLFEISQHLLSDPVTIKKAPVDVNILELVSNTDYSKNLTWDENIADFVNKDYDNMQKLLDNKIIDNILFNIQNVGAIREATVAKRALSKLLQIAKKDEKNKIIKELQKPENMTLMLSVINAELDLKKAKIMKEDEITLLSVLESDCNELAELIKVTFAYSKERLEQYIANKELQQQRLEDLLYSQFLKYRFIHNNLEAVNILAKIDKDAVVKNIVDNKFFDEINSTTIEKYIKNSKSNILHSFNQLEILEDIEQELYNALFRTINYDNSTTYFTYFIQELVEQEKTLKPILVDTSYKVIANVINLLQTKSEQKNRLESLNNKLKILTNDQLERICNELEKYNKEIHKFVLRSYIQKNNLFEIDTDKVTDLQLKPQIAKYISEFISTKMQNYNVTEKYAKDLLQIDFVKFLNNLSALDNSDEINKTLFKCVYIYYFHNQSENDLDKNKDTPKNKLKKALDEESNRTLKQRIQQGYEKLELDDKYDTSQKNDFYMTYSFLFPKN